MSLFKAFLPYLSPIISPDWTIYKNVKYGVTDEEQADLYLLNHGVHPVAVFIHGGGWSTGDKSAYEGRARKYALAGFHVVSINYRLAKYEDKSSQWSAQLDDVKCAIRWIRQNAITFRIDPLRVGVGGDSAGAHLALMLGADISNSSNSRSNLYSGASYRPTCILDMFGPCDLSQQGMKELIAGLPLFNNTPFEKNPELYKSASPIYKINALFPPTCIVHGYKDETVPYTQSLMLDQKLTQLGVYHQFHSFEGGHETNKLSGFEQLNLEMIGLNFMRQILNP